jgi:small-conductance mechanosensitive channel
MEEVLVSLFIVLVYSLIGFLLAKFIDGGIKTLTRYAPEENIALRRFLLKIPFPIYLVLTLTGANYAISLYGLFFTYNSTVDTVLFISWTIVIAITISRLIGIVVNFLVRRHQHLKKAPHLISVLISVLTFTIAIYFILKYFNVEVTPYLATLGIGGVAVGLALQGTLSNFFSGLHIIGDKPINVGDFIEIDEKTFGWVEDIGSISTRVKTINNTMAIIPNSKLASSILINNSMPNSEVSLRVPLQVSYEANLEKVEKITVQIAKKIQQKIPGAVTTFEPYVRFDEFSEYNIKFKVILRAERFFDTYSLKHEFIKAIKKEFDKEKIELGVPVRKIVKS